MVDEVLELNLSNPAVMSYVDYLSGTESPQTFHAWCMVSAAAACMTRRVHFKYGTFTIYPNQYIALVGPPGVRKSTAIGQIKKLIDGIDNIRFGPDDTAGQRQGLIQCMIGFDDEDQEKEETNFADNMGNFSLDDMDDLDYGSVASLDPNDRHSLFIAAGELVSFLGMGSLELVACIGHIWDCPKEYEYSLKTAQTKVTLPCLNILGGITPSLISASLPTEAIGGGFMSRTLLIFEDQHKVVAWPDELDPNKAAGFRNIFRWISEILTGEMKYTPGAKAALIKYYAYRTEIEDARFIHYQQRRQDHLVKTAMAMCALRCSNEMTEDDVHDAHILLRVTEARMPEALGEYGLSKFALAKSRIVDVLANARLPLSATAIFGQIGRDVSQRDFNSAVTELLHHGRVVQFDLKDKSNVVKPGYMLSRYDDSAPGSSRVIPVNYTHDLHTARDGGKARQTKALESAAGRPGATFKPEDSTDFLGSVAEKTSELAEKPARNPANEGKTVLQILRESREKNQ